MRNSTARLAAAIAVMAALCSGQPPKEPEKTASVEGQVNHALTGEPLVRAHVMLSGGPNLYGANTTAEGKFSVTGIAPGNYQVRVEKVGFVQPPGADARVSLLLKADDRKDGLKLKMTPTGAITGRVTDAEGEPVEGANVSTEGAISAAAQTDEKGNFRIGGLTPGKYRVRATLNFAMPFGPEIRTDGTEEYHNAATYHPSVLSAKEAARVEVRTDGEAGGADIRLLRVPWVRVSGRVIGLPAGTDRASIVSRPAHGYGNMGSGLVKPDGSFEIWRLDPGRYLISAGWNGGGNQYEQTAPREVEVAGSNLDGIELQVVPDADIPGSVNFEDDAARQAVAPPPAPNAQQGSQQQRPPFRRMITLRELSNNGGGQFAFDETGTFVLKQIKAGKYRVLIQPNSVYVKSMRLGPQSIEGSLLDLSNGAGAADLSVLVSSHVGSIAGTVIDDHAAGTRIILTPDGVSDMGSRRFAMAAQDGTYKFGNLEPGTYKLVAVQDGDTDTVMQFNGLDLYEDLMDTVEVHPDDKVVKDLKRRGPEDR